MLDEDGQGLVQPSRLDAGRKGSERGTHRSRVDGRAVQLDGVMEDLVDQAHGVELAGLDDRLREARRIAAVVHSLGE